MIELERINNNKKELLNNLLQLYLHDISIYFPIDFNSKTCKYEYDDLAKYFNESDNYAYLFLKDKDIVGFTLIDREDDNYIVQEMFILNNYKNNGVGEECINEVFNCHKGNWTIKSLPCSPKSENFWNKTIKKYTNNKYDIEHIGKYNRAVFRFNNQ